VKWKKKENLSEDSNFFKLVDEDWASLSLQNVVEKASEHIAVIVEVLEGDFLRYVVSDVRHWWQRSTQTEKNEEEESV